MENIPEDVKKVLKIKWVMMCTVLPVCMNQPREMLEDDVDTITTRNLIISGHIISGQRIVAANDHIISGQTQLAANSRRYL
jgi:hypothetical protein